MLARHRMDSQMSDYDQVTTATGNTPARLIQNDIKMPNYPKTNVQNSNVFTRFGVKPEIQQSINQQSKGVTFERPQMKQTNFSPAQFKQSSYMKRGNLPKELGQLSTRGQLLQ